jgi:alanine racemase
MRGYINGIRVPLVGRVSMDSCMFDITDANVSLLENELLCVEILGSNASIHTLAKAANTISYEILTSLGLRYERNYL